MTQKGSLLLIVKEGSRATAMVMIMLIEIFIFILNYNFLEDISMGGILLLLFNRLLPY